MSSIGNWRCRILRWIALGFWCLLGARLIQLQWASHADFSRQASHQRIAFEAIPAHSGEILDREGRVVLATTISVKSVYTVPSRIEDAESVATALADALSLDREELLERLTKHRKKQFLWVKRRIADAEADQLRKLELSDRIWGFRDECLRQYPMGRLAAHVIGLRDIDGRGRCGLERSLDPWIGGRPGRRRLVRDALGRVIDIQDDVEQTPIDGRSVAVTLDVMIQLYVERELDRVVDQWKPRNASAIVLDPKSGEILAMASRPTFDPNVPQEIPEAAWKNHAVSAEFEPGSTLKPLIVAWAIQRGVIRGDETFDCEYGTYRMGRRLLHDHHPYGTLSVADILVKSSNIGMAKIGERLANEGLFQALATFGFGRKTGIELPGEVAGIVRPLKDWNTYSTGSVPMGQEVAATALQIITAHGALANGGRLVRPTLIRYGPMVARPANQWTGRGVTRIVDRSSAHRFRPAVISETVHPDIAHWLVEGPLTDVVRRGTGRRARLDDYAVFGKTGTAQKTDPETNRYSSTKHVSSFVCGAPAQDPRVLVLVVVDEPSVEGEHFGGVLAAPAAARILKYALMRLGVPATTDVARNQANSRM